MQELIISLGGIALVALLVSSIIAIFPGPDKKASKELAKVLLAIAIIVIATAIALKYEIFNPILERIRFG